jgi:hypothetical protein
MLPNFLIPGAEKAGTTSLKNYLFEHPEIFIVDKEIHFFDQNWDKGIEWYEEKFSNYNGEKVIGEKTPGYMYTDVEHIKSVLPDVKFIFCLRNPIERAYSQYWHDVRKGREKMPFNKAIKKKNIIYKERSKYINYLKKFSEHYPKSQMLFILTEDLKYNRRETLKTVLKFLKVDDKYNFKDLSEENVGGMPRSKFLAELAEKKPIKKNVYFYRLIKTINLKRKGNLPKIETETRKYLEEYFDEYNQELKKFTGLNLDKWER